MRYFSIILGVGELFLRITENGTAKKNSPEKRKTKSFANANSRLSGHLQEYDIFNKTQPIESDFDKIVKGLGKKI